jgi:hypothetical protein
MAYIGKPFEVLAMDALLSLSSKGQLVIPARLRQLLGLNPGDRYQPAGAAAYRRRPGASPPRDPPDRCQLGLFRANHGGAGAGMGSARRIRIRAVLDAV